MKKHYQEIVDEVFGELYQHRTLRTIFDPYSSEWSDTRLSRKLEILQILLKSEKITLEEILYGYKNFYLFELYGKEHVVSSLDEGLMRLLNYSLMKTAQ